MESSIWMYHTIRQVATLRRGAKDLMDYWSVGAEVTVLPVGVSIGIHPVEILDAALGFLFIDIKKDDY